MKEEKIIMSKQLTVIVPVYNDQTNIVRCLESLFNQTYDKMEVIVVNDASTDNTLAVLENYRSIHPLTIINMNENSGAAHCRNIGILSAKTPYITFVDSDDWVDMSTYTRCFDQISYNTDIIIYGLIYDYVLMDRRNKKYNYSMNYKMTGEFALNIYSNCIPNEIRITPIVNNKVYRRKYLIDNNILFHEELRYQEDDVFTFEALSRASFVYFVKDCYYHYCQREYSLIHTVSEMSVRSFIEAYLILESDLISNQLFEKYKQAFYLKLKGSLLGVIRRIIDYEPRINERNRLMQLLLELVVEKYDVSEILKTIDLSVIRSIL